MKKTSGAAAPSSSSEALSPPDSPGEPAAAQQPRYATWYRERLKNPIPEPAHQTRKELFERRGRQFAQDAAKVGNNVMYPKRDMRGSALMAACLAPQPDDVKPHAAADAEPDGIRVLGLTNMAVCLSFFMLDLFAVRLANPKSVTTYCSGRRPSYA